MCIVFSLLKIALKVQKRTKRVLYHFWNDIGRKSTIKDYVCKIGETPQGSNDFAFFFF